MSEERRRLTPEEILDEIHHLARTGDDANKRWALKVLAPEESAKNYLVEPMTVHEVKERLVRILRATGKSLAKMAWNHAFTGQDVPTDDLEIAANEDMIPADAMVYINKMTRIKHLYVLAPALKRAGTMHGTPRKGGKEAVARFVKEQAKKVVIERIRTHKDWFTAQPLKAKETDDVTTAVEAEGLSGMGD